MVRPLLKSWRPYKENISQCNYNITRVAQSNTLFSQWNTTWLSFTWQKPNEVLVGKYFAKILGKKGVWPIISLINSPDSPSQG